MKVFVFSILALFIFSAIHGQTSENESPFENLNGKVKKVSSLTYITLRSAPIYKGVALYDKNGRIISNTSYNMIWGRFRAVSKEQYFYDLKGNVIERATFNSMENTKSTIKYTYNHLNNLIEYQSYQDDKLEFGFLRNYDDDGKLVEQINYRTDSTINFKTINSYNDDKQLVNTVFLNPDSTFRGMWITEYDENGNQTHYTIDNDSSVVFKSITFFDDKNRVIEKWVEAYQYNNKSKTSYKYSEQGNLVEVVSFDYNDDK